MFYNYVAMQNAKNKINKNSLPFFLFFLIRIPQPLNANCADYKRS